MIPHEIMCENYVCSTAQRTFSGATLHAWITQIYITSPRLSICYQSLPPEDTSFLGITEKVTKRRVNCMMCSILQHINTAIFFMTTAGYHTFRASEREQRTSYYLFWMCEHYD